jgi:uridine phosphorylase
MNRQLLSSIALSLAALSAGTAFAAQPAALTREQVTAELVEAQRTGDIVVVQGSTMKKLNEFYPGNYPAKATPAGKTSEQVTAELVEAQRTGEIVVVQGSTMKKLNEFYPGNYPTALASTESSQPQVLAESTTSKRVNSN